MFRDDRQLAAVCQALCARAGVASLWTPLGPSERAKELLDTYGGTMATGEWTLLLVAWALWNGKGKLTVVDLIDRLDRGNLETVGELLVALAQGTEAIDAWIAEAQRQSE